MCKIMVIAGLNPENEDLNWEFIQEMGSEMSKRNNDGLGYTAITETGEMFGEKWHNNYDAFDYRPKSRKFLDKYKGVISFPEAAKQNKYAKFGTLDPKIVAVVLHTRMATSGKEFANTHPFIDLEKDTSLIHNGVINNVTVADNIRSTCDSERILNKYLEFEVMKEPDNIQKVIDELRGYFACGIVTRDKDNKRVIDVFKSRAMLDAVYVNDLGAMVFTTSAQDVKDVCKEMKLTIEHEGTVEANKLFRLDPLTGNVLKVIEYKDTANPYPVQSYDDFHRNYRRTETHSNKRSRILSEADWRAKSEDTVNNVTDVNDIIDRSKYNLSEAEKDGYTLDKTSGVYIKRKKSV